MGRATWEGCVLAKSSMKDMSSGMATHAMVSSKTKLDGCVNQGTREVLNSLSTLAAETRVSLPRYHATWKGCVLAKCLTKDIKCGMAGHVTMSFTTKVGGCVKQDTKEELISGRALAAATLT